MNNDCCAVCGSAAFAPVLELPGIPVEEGRLAADAADAIGAARGDVSLWHCSRCGLVYDTAPRLDPVEYSRGYSTFLGHSPSIARHVRQVAGGLVERYGLVGGTVVDIGCGFGDFMAALLEHGMARGVGIDPAAADPPDRRIRMVREYFAPGRLPPGPVELVACRHMLYSVDDPVRLLRDLRGALGDRSATVYLELVDRRPALRSSDPWDITYEHFSYFTEESAGRMLRMCGFQPLDTRQSFDGRFLTLEARSADRPWSADPSWTSSLTEDILGLQNRVDRRIRRWREALAAVRAAGGRVLGWCAGSRAIAFLALAGAHEEVVGVVDLSPSRQGRFLPVSATPVVPPVAVRELAPTAILVTNPWYTSEIRLDVAAMGAADLPIIDLDEPDAPELLVRAARRLPESWATVRH